MTDTTSESSEPEPRNDGALSPRVVGVAALAIAAVVVAALVIVTNGGESSSEVTTTTLPPVQTTPSTVTAPPTSFEPATTIPGEEFAAAVWPLAASPTRFEDPIAAVSSFATDFVGFVDPVIGEYAQSDARSGEVEVQSRADGPTTTVFVRQLGPENSWWVLGAATLNIQVDQPKVLSAITSPVHLAGRASAFEGNVNVKLYSDGQVEPIIEGFVTGSGDGTLGPFQSDLAFPAPSAGGWGALVLRVYSAEDGSVEEAAVLSVSFGG